MNSFASFSNYVNEHAESLALEVVDGVISAAEMDIPDWEREKAITTYIKLWQFMGTSLVEENEDKVPASLIEWSKGNSKMQVTSGGEFSELVVRYPPTRSVFIEIITRISIELNMSVSENAKIIKRINELLDISLNETFFSYKRLTERHREETEEELIKLSTPLVPIIDDIVVLPLIGSLNLAVTKHIMDNVLHDIDNLDANHIIADFSGVLTIDAKVSESLRQIGRGLRLMGKHVVITGLRPAIVRTVVESGLGLSDNESYATVKQAIESIQRDERLAR